MYLGDPLNHGQTKPASAVLAAGRIDLIKSLPDFFLLIFRDADSIITHRKKRFFFISAQRQMYLPVRFTVFKRVVQQILNQAREQDAVSFYGNILLKCICQPFVFEYPFLTYGLGELDEINIFKLNRCSFLIQACHIQKL